jgi:ABC-type polysaccharide/polyol phosphate export permease
VAERRFLLGELAWTEFKLTDQGTLLGFLWTLLYPALMFAVLYALFIKWLGRFVDRYAAYLLVGLVFWNFFQRATSLGLSSLTRRSALVQNFKVPLEDLVLSSVAAAFLSFLLELAVLGAFLAALGCPPSWSWLTAGGHALALLLLAYGASLFLARLAVEFQDVQRIWDVLSTALFYLTPVFYPLDIISPSKRAVLLLNPLARVLVSVRGCLIDGRAPGAAGFVALLLASGLLVAAGTLFLRRGGAKISDELMKL